MLGHRWESERGDCTCTCVGSQVGKRERRLSLYLDWVTGGKEREETVPVPGLGHRWESEKGDCACTWIGSQVGKRERRLCLYLCWVTGGKARKETVPVPVLGHRWENERKETVPVPVPGQSAGLIPDSSAHCVRCHSCRPDSEDSLQLTLYSLAPTLLQLLYNKHFK